MFRLTWSIQFQLLLYHTCSRSKGVFYSKLRRVASLNSIGHPWLNHANKEMNQLVDDLLLGVMLLSQIDHLSPERFVLTLHCV